MKEGKTNKILTVLILLLIIPLFINTSFGQEDVPVSPEKTEKTEKTVKEILLADFETATPEGFRVEQAEIELKEDNEDAPAGKGFLEIEVLELADRERKAVQLTFKLPEGMDMSCCKSLSAHVKLPALEDRDEWKLRWNVLNGEEKQIYQRMFEMQGSEDWQKIEWPLSVWRWSNQRVGDWSEARYLVLNIEIGNGTVGIDDIRLVGGERGKMSAMPKPEWIAGIAFPGGCRSMLKESVFIATDDLENLSENDLKSISERVEPIRKWIRATFKKAVRPIGGDAPVSLIIFKEMDGYKNFYVRLGDAWNVSIGTPGAGGYTVQDIAASTYSARYGADRPVWFHELVHAIATRELRLIPGQRIHSWLQEGLANYLQLCIYPKSIGRDMIVRNFNQSITRRSFFKPLRTLLTGRITTRNYLQLATLTAFLVQEHPDWLDKIALGITSGKDLEKVLEEDIETSFEKLQDDWHAWGKKVFAFDSEPPDGPGRHFPMPSQWVKEKIEPDDESKESATGDN